MRSDPASCAAADARRPPSVCLTAATALAGPSRPANRYGAHNSLLGLRLGWRMFCRGVDVGHRLLQYFALGWDQWQRGASNKVTQETMVTNWRQRYRFSGNMEDVSLGSRPRRLPSQRSERDDFRLQTRVRLIHLYIHTVCWQRQAQRARML